MEACPELEPRHWFLLRIGDAAGFELTGSNGREIPVSTLSGLLRASGIGQPILVVLQAATRNTMYAECTQADSTTGFL